MKPPLSASPAAVDAWLHALVSRMCATVYTRTRIVRDPVGSEAGGGAVSPE